MGNLANFQPHRAEGQRAARANEYRRSLPHAVNFGAQVFGDLADAGTAHCLIAIAEVDSCTAGAMLAELAAAYAQQLAEKMTEGDGGHLIKTPLQQPLEYYIQRVQSAINHIKGL